MLAGSELAAALAMLPAQPFEGVLYRAIHYAYLLPSVSPQPLYSLGAVQRGARFTPRGAMPTLYLAEEAETALIEANPPREVVRLRNRRAIGPLQPTVLIQVNARLDTVLDLTIPAVLQALGTSPAELRRPWRLLQDSGAAAPTQALGMAAFVSERIQAIRYLSARVRGGHCIAIFPERVASPAFIEVYDPSGHLVERIPSSLPEAGEEH